MSKESETRQSYKICTSRPIAMLDIRATGRDAVALPYSYLEMVQFDPSVAIVLTFTTCEVRIEGHCLPALYDALVQHSVEYMQENDATYEQANDKLPFISRIEIKALSQDVNLIVEGFDPEREPLEKWEAVQAVGENGET
jgi:hypothetical protein